MLETGCRVRRRGPDGSGVVVTVPAAVVLAGGLPSHAEMPGDVGPAADLIEDAIDQLAAEGPALRRPLADRVRGSRFHNMKELRPPSSGTTEIRLLFAFDPRRKAIFLVAGDKAGNWEGWYREAIPLADARFAQHLTELEEEEVK